MSGKIDKSYDKYRARYKLVVTFAEGKRLHGNCLATIQAMESAKHLNVDNDMPMMFCAHKDKAVSAGNTGGCNHFFSADYARASSPDIGLVGFSTCPHCGKQWESSSMSDMLYYNMPIKMLAERVATFFLQLGDCDVYMINRGQNVVRAHYDGLIEQEQSKANHGKIVIKKKGRSAKKRIESQQLSLYTFKTIMKDTIEGTELSKALYLFLRSRD